MVLTKKISLFKNIKMNMYIHILCTEDNQCMLKVDQRRATYCKIGFPISVINLLIQVVYHSNQLNFYAMSMLTLF